MRILPPDNIGIDKIKLFTREYSVKDVSDCGMKLVQGTVDMKTGQIPSDIPLFKDSYGRNVTGSKCIRNTDLYNLTINGYGLDLQFNPSKPYHPFNLVGNQDDLNDRIGYVLHDLKQYGITADFENAKIKRLDIARNILMDDAVKSYSGVWSHLKLQRSTRTAMYPDGYGTGNKSQGIIIYDKGKETRERAEQDWKTYMKMGGSIGGDICPKPSIPYPNNNLLRCEWQLKRNRTIAEQCQISTLSQIKKWGVFQTSNQYKYYIENVFNQNMDNHNQSTINFNNSVERLTHLKEFYGNSATRVERDLLSALGFLTVYHTPDNYRQALLDSGHSRMSADRGFKKFKSAIQLFNEYTIKHDKLTVGKQLQELRKKLVA